MAVDGTSMRGTSVAPVVLLAGLATACTLGVQEGCTLPSEVARVDVRNQRLFVEASAAQVVDSTVVNRLILDSAEFIARCHAGWSPQWSLSFFSNKKYAGYRDEQPLRPYVVSGEWMNAYVAEYDHAARKLVRYPVHPEKRAESLIRSP